MKAAALEFGVDLLVLAFIGLLVAGSVHHFGKARACETHYGAAQAAQK